MIPINEKKHVKRLNDKKIVIEERFYDKKNKNQQILIRTSNYEKNDTIIECPRLEKEYFHNGKSIYTETRFNPDIKYTYISNIDSDETVECPSCGYTDKAKMFLEGCPYCDTEFSINISKKREKIKDIVLNDSTAFFVVLIIGIILVKLNIISYEVIFSLVVFIEVLIFIYLLFEIIKETSHRDIWDEFKVVNMNINKQRVYNDLNMQLKDIYYDNTKEEYLNLIDFDIIRYVHAALDRGKDIILTYRIRKYYFDGTNINAIENYSKVRLTRNTKVKVKKNFSTKCKNCGSPVNSNDKECSYCGTKNESSIGWIISEIIDDEIDSKLKQEK